MKGFTRPASMAKKVLKSRHNDLLDGFLRNFRKYETVGWMNFDSFFRFPVSILWIWPFVFGCVSLKANSAPGDADEGYAVYYADSLNGNPTASGEPYDKTALTAAHRTLPFGTVVRVTHLANRRSVQVRINDRGPFSGRHNVIDLSRAAAERIEMIRDGVVPVRLEIVSIVEGR